MQRIDRDALWDMQVFAAVVDGGSIAAGARAVGATPSAISKRLAALERRLGTRLLHRTTRQLRITTEGATYVERARELLHTVAKLESCMQENGGALRGEIRISAPTLLGQELLTGVIARFLRQHPEVSAHLELSDRLVDLVSEPFDVAIRVATHLEAKELIARRVGVLETILVASPGYVKERGAPENVASLSTHAVLEAAFDGNRGRWDLQTRSGIKSVAVRGPLVCSSLGALRQAALAGLGVAQLPRYLVQSDLRARRLVHLLPKCTADQRSVFVVRASRAFVPSRVRALTEFIARELPALLKPS